VPVRNAKYQRPLYALPGGVNLAEFDFTPTWQELEFDRYHRAKLIYEKEWMLASMKGLAEIGLEIEEQKRRNALADEQEQIYEWFMEQALKESEVNKKFLARCQDELDGPYLRAQLAKLDKAGKEIRHELAEIEKTEMIRRGVYKGRR
jgi:hypothetical protein